MAGIMHRLKRMFLEPQVYALILESRKGTVLHLGTHYTLDEAIRAATPRLLEMTPHNKGDNVKVEMWTSLKGSDVVNSIVSPDNVPIGIGSTLKEKGPEQIVSVDEHIKLFKESKNKLMEKLITEGSLEKVDASKDIFNASEFTFIVDKITGKKEHGKTK